MKRSTLLAYSFEDQALKIGLTDLLVLPHSALRDEALAAQLAVVALDAEVLVLRLLVLVQVVLLGRPVVTLVAYIWLLSRMCVHVLSEFVFSSKFAT